MPRGVGYGRTPRAPRQRKPRKIRSTLKLSKARFPLGRATYHFERLARGFGKAFTHFGQR